jgi:excisionase family DNA binding protein
MDELVPVDEAARRLGGVSRWSVYGWLSKGRLRKTKVGGRVMIAVRDLEAFIESCNKRNIHDDPKPAAAARRL